MNEQEFILKIKKRLLEESEKDYKEFSAGLIPNINNVLGIRLPVLRKIAKAIHLSSYCEEFLKFNDVEFMEERMLQGMVIGLLDYTPENILLYVKDFVPHIDNWSVCDSFCTSLKFVRKNKELVWNFIQPYLVSEKEFEIRFGLVMILGYFVEEKYLARIFEIFDRIDSDDYYAKMAAAWAVSVCFAKFPDETLEYLKHSNLSKWIFNKSIQKCIESYRVTGDMKNQLRKMKIC